MNRDIGSGGGVGGRVFQKGLQDNHPLLDFYSVYLEKDNETNTPVCLLLIQLDNFQYMDLGC